MKEYILTYFFPYSTPLQYPLINTCNGVEKGAISSNGLSIPPRSTP